MRYLYLLFLYSSFVFAGPPANHNPPGHEHNPPGHQHQSRGGSGDGSSGSTTPPPSISLPSVYSNTTTSKSNVVLPGSVKAPYHPSTPPKKKNNDLVTPQIYINGKHIDDATNKDLNNLINMKGIKAATKVQKTKDGFDLE